jgi:hypothetical protein
MDRTIFKAQAVPTNNGVGETLMFNETNRHAEAEPLFPRALSINKKNLGPEHPDVANSLNCLAESIPGTKALSSPCADGVRALPGSEGTPPAALTPGQ